MAKTKAKKSPSKKTAKAKSNDSIVRIRASVPTEKKKGVVSVKSTNKATAVKATKPSVAKAPKKTKVPRGALRAPKAAGGYFKGAWFELRQVRWPNRRATWGLTAAVLAYSAFFVILVLLLDAGFKYLFELILGK